MPSPRLLAFALVAALAQAVGAQTPPPAAPAPAEPAAGAGPAPAKTAPGKGDERTPEKDRPRAAVLEEVLGTVVTVDRKAHRIVLETASGRIELGLDRNTMVYTDQALGTVLDLKPGDRIRVGRNADFLAYWIQVRPGETRPARPAEPDRPAEPASAPTGGSPAR